MSRLTGRTAPCRPRGLECSGFRIPLSQQKPSGVFRRRHDLAGYFTCRPGNPHFNASNQGALPPLLVRQGLLLFRESARLDAGATIREFGRLNQDDRLGLNWSEGLGELLMCQGLALAGGDFDSVTNTGLGINGARFQPHFG